MEKIIFDFQNHIWFSENGDVFGWNHYIIEWNDTRFRYLSLVRLRLDSENTKSTVRIKNLCPQNLCYYFYYQYNHHNEQSTHISAVFKKYCYKENPVCISSVRLLGIGHFGAVSRNPFEVIKGPGFCPVARDWMGYWVTCSSNADCKDPVYLWPTVVPK